MAAPPIGIFGRADDKQTRAVAQAVQESGGEPLIAPIRLDAAHAPPVAFGEGRFHWNGIDFSEVPAVYIRGMAPNTLPAMPPVMNEDSYSEWRWRYVREQQYQATSYSFFRMLGDAGTLVVNPLERYVLHNAKGQFYERMRAAGFDFPDTLTTNIPDEARAFIDKHAQAVVKPGIGVGSTRMIWDSDRERLDEVRSCPVMLQEYIKGDTLRLHVVGNTVVLALKILGEGIDSRTGTKGFEPYDLPDAQRREMARAHAELGLHWATWDILASEDRSRYAMLDCNPGGYCMWIGPDNVRIVFRELARYLLAYAKTRSDVEARKAVEAAVSA